MGLTFVFFFPGSFNFNLTTVGYLSIRFISLILVSLPLALPPFFSWVPGEYQCAVFAESDGLVSSVCVRFLIRGCVLS